MNRTLRTVLIAAVLVLSAGCGNKGPLMLPTPPVDPATVPEEPAETTPAETPVTEPTDDSTTPPVEVPADTPATSDGDGNG